MKIDYKEAGVDVLQGQKAVQLMKESVQSTFSPLVLTELGSFAGLMTLPSGIEEPVLVSGTDGVGTKILFAQQIGDLSTIGQDLVAMCVNDILCHGAKPLFFLDYLATGKLVPERISAVVASIAEACKKVGCALIGGETAEMPGLYEADEIDMAGFAVGVISKKDIITGRSICQGDVLLGLASSGFHSNGYSLLRKVFLEHYPEKLDAYKERLIRPTTLYQEAVFEAMKAAPVKGIAHITGGGFFENIPRIIPSGLCFDIELASWQRDPMFEDIKLLTGLEDHDLYSTFNMGIGMVLVVDAEHAATVMERVSGMGQSIYRIGQIVKGEQGILR